MTVAPPAFAEPAPGTADFTGYVVTDDGRPIAGARVLVTDRFELSTADFTGPGFGTDPALGVAATTDATGFYDAPGVPAGPTATDRWVAAYVPGRGVLWSRTSVPASGEPVPTKAGDEHVADLHYPAGGGTLRGTVTVRGGRSPEQARLLVTLPTGQTSTIAHAGRDGSFEIAVPAGPYILSVSSRLGLGRLWTGIPGVWGSYALPPTSVAAGQTVELGSTELPPRMQYDAVDEYGFTESGFDGPAPDGTVGEYPFDDVRPPGRVIGPRLVVGAPVGLTFPDEPPTSELTIKTGMTLAGTVTLTNTGDDDVRMSAPRFEGPDAALFSCRTNIFAPPCPRRALPPLFDPGGRPRPGGSSFLFDIGLDATTYRDVYRATMVFDTNVAPGTVRIPLDIRNLLAPGTQASRLPSVAAPPQVVAKASPGRLGRALSAPVRLARSSVKVSFPGAGTARVQIERPTTRRRNGKVRRTWSPVRTLQIRATRRATITRKIETLRPGTYRLRVRTSIVGHRPRTATTIRTVRR